MVEQKSKEVDKNSKLNKNKLYLENTTIKNFINDTYNRESLENILSPTNNIKKYFKFIKIEKDQEQVRRNNNEYNNFHSLWIFYIDNNIKNQNQKIFYDIFYRRILLNENYVDEFIFDDISDLMNYKQYFIDENIKKQKLFAKIAHEFKTPLNSLIGITGIIRDSEEYLSTISRNRLEIVNNLSNYLIFLISDVIHYANLGDISEIKTNITKFNLIETLILLPNFIQFVSLQ